MKWSRTGNIQRGNRYEATHSWRDASGRYHTVAIVWVDRLSTPSKDCESSVMFDNDRSSTLTSKHTSYRGAMEWIADRLSQVGCPIKYKDLVS